jgi:hypothetical protein
MTMSYENGSEVARSGRERLPRDEIWQLGADWLNIQKNKYRDHAVAHHELTQTLERTLGARKPDGSLAFDGPDEEDYLA